MCFPVPLFPLFAAEVLVLTSKSHDCFPSSVANKVKKPFYFKRGAEKTAHREDSRKLKLSLSLPQAGSLGSACFIEHGFSRWSLSYSHWSHAKPKLHPLLLSSLENMQQPGPGQAWRCLHPRSAEQPRPCVMPASSQQLRIKHRPLRFPEGLARLNTFTLNVLCSLPVHF